MPGLFSRLKGRDGKLKSKKKGQLEDQLPQKPRWEDAWARKTVEADEVQQLIRFCTEELKARGMYDINFGAYCAYPLHGVEPCYCATRGS